MHGAVYAALNVEVAAYGEHVCAVCVARPHLQKVVPGIDKAGYFHAKGRISALVGGGRAAVNEHVGHGIDPFEEQKQAVLSVQHGLADGEVALIHHCLAVV